MHNNFYNLNHAVPRHPSFNHTVATFLIATIDLNVIVLHPAYEKTAFGPVGWCLSKIFLAFDFWQRLGILL